MFQCLLFYLLCWPAFLLLLSVISIPPSTAHKPATSHEKQFLVHLLFPLIHSTINLPVMTHLKTCHHSHPLPKAKLLNENAKSFPLLAPISLFIHPPFHCCALLHSQTRQGTLPSVPFPFLFHKGFLLLPPPFTEQILLRDIL